tara:strand:- start:24672 stop:24809 length:138 start_codon:yes stop_codon:yes gene_type:complete
MDMVERTPFLNAGTKIQHKKNKKEMFNILQGFIFQLKSEVTNIIF